MDQATYDTLKRSGGEAFCDTCRITRYFTHDENGEIFCVSCGNEPEPDGKEIEAAMEREASTRLAAASPRLLAALANLAAYANGKLGRNPYGIPEYQEALQAIAEAIGYTGDWMDTLDKVKGRL